MSLKLLEPFIVRPDAARRQDHWQGGPPVHEKAICCQCKRPLQLIWNMNTSDPRFVSNSGRRLFHTIGRLCLYWCVRCFTSLDYILRDDRIVETIAVNGEPA